MTPHIYQEEIERLITSCPYTDPAISYTVTADAGDLEGWTPESLARALEGPLGRCGIEVLCKPSQVGDGGMGEYWFDGVRLSIVERIVEMIISGGPAD